MKCPNCQHTLTIVICKNNLAVDHCNLCGASMFRENEINRLTLSDAKKLSKKMVQQLISGSAKLCPWDKKTMTAITGESVPHFVTLLSCPECRRVLTYADDLVSFKRAQQAKINYFKTWEMPIPTLKSVLIVGTVLAISLSTLFTLSPIFTRPTSLKAGNELCLIQISRINNTTIAYCATNKAYTSSANFKNLITGEVIVRDINSKPKQSHILSIADDDILPSVDIDVQFAFKSDDEVLTTDFVPFVENN